jgi:two-component system heavy metal sensor histidine kinase CusS
MRHSIARRLAILFTVATLVIVALVSAVVDHVLTAQMSRYQKRQLSSALHDRAYQIERIDRVDLWQRVDRKMAVLTPPDSGMRYWVLSADPRFRYGAGLDPEAVRHAANGQMTLVRIPDREEYFHVLARHFEANGERPAVTLAVGIDTHPFAEARRILAIVLGVLSLAAVAIAYALGHIVARIGLRPLQALSDQAGALSASNLAQRLSLSPLPHELASVTGAVNGALDRLERAYLQLEAFNADVAHELRTPLANLIGLTQVTLARPREASELTDVMLANLDDLERLRAIVNDMLFLARADRGEAPAAVADTRIAEAVGTAVAFLEPILEDAGKTIAVEGDLAARAAVDASLFVRALVNLLHNAILYSTPRAHLVVKILDMGSQVGIDVVNPGETIDPAHLPRLFDRFYRVDPARYKLCEQKGHGLGLAIAKAIAHMHGGTVSAHSSDGLTTIGFSVAAAPFRIPPRPHKEQA